MIIIRMLLMTAGLLFCWQGIVTHFQLPPYILPTPAAVFTSLYDHRLLLINEMLPTLAELCLGLLAGITLGCIVGMITAGVRTLKPWLLALLIISQAIPLFALAPLFVIWFGYGMASKVITTMLMVFFPIASALYDGLQKMPVDWLNLARTMNAHPLKLFFCIRIPAALPSLASGIRIAAAAAPLGTIVGEWVGASHGLGFLMLNANGRMDIELMFASVILLILMSLFCYFLIDYLLNKFIWWPDH